MISFSSWYPDPHPNIKIVRIAIPYQNSEMIQIQLKLIRIRKSGTRQLKTDTDPKIRDLEAQTNTDPKH